MKQTQTDSVQASRVQDSGPARAGSHLLFDRISARYDLLNGLLSFRQDVRWRKRLSRVMEHAPHGTVLDLACGTCDSILAFFSRNHDMQWGLGIDMAERMLALGKRKIVGRGLDSKISLTRGDGMDIPVADNSFDFAIISFGIRNMIDPERSLLELYRVLKPGGWLAVLEFSLPSNRFFRYLYLLYFRHLLPLIGGAISGDRDAYRYLNRTVETFYQGPEFCRMVEMAGFRNIVTHTLAAGIATIYCGDKG